MGPSTYAEDRSTGDHNLLNTPDPAAWNADDTLVFADSSRRRVFSQCVSVVALAIYAAYLTYRALYTINPDAPVFSMLVYLAEVHGFIAFFFFVFQLWAIRKRRVPSPPPGLRVDVFITTYDEDVTLLRQTVRGAMHMRYPHRTFILDDGRREAVQALARELGCGYITRPGNEHAKAGNWNNAFAQTDADFIATFDADHVPRSTFLVRTLGFFRDRRVALVQVPQQFHNFDSIQHRVDWHRRRVHAEQSAFFDLVMPGKDHYNAAFFCGTGAVLRRAALEPYDGIQTGTVTEDLHTSIVLHAAKWKSVYVHENLVTGLATMDFKSFSTQRLRWAEGNLKVVGHINPLTCAGLSLAQRVSYLGSLFHWTTGLQKVVFYLAPPWMLASGTFPIANFDAQVVTIYLAFLISLTVAYKIVSRGSGRLLMDELYNMVTCYTLIKAVARAALGRRRPAVFQVTAKWGTDAVAYREAFPHLALVAVSIGALSWSAMGLGFGIRDDAFGAGVAAFWTLYNLALAGTALRLALRPVQKRHAYRCRAHVAVESVQSAGPTHVGLTSDISEHGCNLLWPERLGDGARFAVRFHVGGRVLQRTIEVRSTHRSRSREWWIHGVEFVNQSQADVDELVDLIHEVVIPDLFGTLSQESTTTRMWRSIRARLPRVLRPRMRRHPMVVPVQVTAPGGTFLSVTSDVSGSGVGIVAPRSLPIGSTLTAELASTRGQRVFHGEVVRAVPRADHHVLGTWHIGVQLADVHAAEQLEHLDAAAA